MLDFQFNENIIGYSYFDEAKTICNLINDVECNDILDVGSFTGKLTWSLCKTFPDKQITALDLFDGVCYVDRINGGYHTTTGRDERYLNQTNTLEFFKNLQSEHTNLTTIKLDFLKFNLTHDVVILGADTSTLDWKKHIDHALSLTPKLIIGRHAYEQDRRLALRSIIKTYNHTFYNHGIYTIQV